jgi:hypothetical protein
MMAFVKETFLLMVAVKETLLVVMIMRIVLSSSPKRSSATTL